MRCEKCGGKGVVIGEPVLEDRWDKRVYAPFVSVCPNPLCHNGHVACCRVGLSPGWVDLGDGVYAPCPACCDGLPEQREANDDKEAL